ALHHKSCVRMAHRAPPQHRYAWLGGMQLNQMTGRSLDVRRIGRAFDRGCVHSVLDHHWPEGCALEDRLPDDRLLPCDGHALGIDAHAQPVEPHRTVIATVHVVLASPDNLDRHPGRFGDVNSLLDEIVRGIGPSSEAASEESGVERYLLWIQARDLGRSGL